MTKKWWEYQKELNPVNLQKGLGSLTLPRRNQDCAKVKAVAISTTMITPVHPSMPFMNHQQLLGRFSPKNVFIGSYSSSVAWSSLGKSHVKCAPACRPTPIAIPAATTLKEKKKKKRTFSPKRVSWHFYKFKEIQTIIQSHNPNKLWSLVLQHYFVFVELKMPTLVLINGQFTWDYL